MITGKLVDLTGTEIVEIQRSARRGPAWEEAATRQREIDEAVQVALKATPQPPSPGTFPPPVSEWHAPPGLSQRQEVAIKLVILAFDGDAAAAAFALMESLA